MIGDKIRFQHEWEPDPIHGEIIGPGNAGPMSDHYISVHIEPNELMRHGIDREPRHREYGMDRQVLRSRILVTNPDTPPITIDFDLAIEILEVLRLTPIYTLLHSDDEDQLGDDFKPHKWEGYELEHAEKANKAHKALIALMTKQVKESE